MNIKEHFDGVEAKHQELVAKTESKKIELKEKVTAKTEEAKQLNKERKKKEDLMRQNQEAGLDTAKLQEMIQELDAKIVKNATESESLHKKAQDIKDVLERKFDREDLMASVLQKEYRCKDAMVVDSLEECFNKYPVKVTAADNAGHPNQCTISVGQQSKFLNIKVSDKYFWKNFRPQSLDWLPFDNESQISQEEDEEFEEKGRSQTENTLVFYDQKADRFILSQKLKWWQDVRDDRYAPSRSENKQVEDNFDDIAIQLGAKLDNLLPAEKAELDLENSYRNNPLLAHACSEIKAQTSSKPIFKASNEQLPSTEIYKRIKAEWDAFVKCAWSSKIKSTLALLKYHSENGEKARFWSGDFEGQYGFRLRTRDHSWIEGDIYILPAADADSKKDSVKMVHYKNNSHSLGRLFLTVENARDERR